MNEAFGALNIIVENDVPVPMRDGTTLRANVFRPDAPDAFPGLLLRTPYGKPAGGYERYVRAGYVVVTQDSRGRYASDGDYVPFTVEETGDAQDGYDSVEWLAEQPYCNGNVGTMGASYNAWMQWMLAKLRPPHLKAMCAYSIPLELTQVDWPGAFKPGRRIRWWMTTLAPDLRKREGLPGPHTPEEARTIWDELEHGRWLGFMPWLELPKYLPARLAEYVEDWLRDPGRKAWRFAENHCKVDVPNLDFSGWYDHCGGTMGHLAGMQQNGRTSAAREQTKLIIGPWNHVGIGSRKVGDIDFGPQAALDIHQVILRWFDYWLKGVENGMDQEPAVRYFVMGAARWETAHTWPPPNPREKVLHFDSGGGACGANGDGLLALGSALRTAADGYTYDPADPVPTLWDRSLFAGPADRRKLEYRPDILYYRTDVLDEDLKVVGHPRVVLHVSCSAPDTDFFVRLVDETPDGPALEVCYGMVRARHRHSVETEEPLVPGEVTELTVELGPTACVFRKGHRVRLEITSSDFPNHDRNHNMGRNDLQDAQLVAAEIKIHHGADRPSRLILPVE